MPRSPFNICVGNVTHEIAQSADILATKLAEPSTNTARTRDSTKAAQPEQQRIIAEVANMLETAAPDNDQTEQQNDYSHRTVIGYGKLFGDVTV